MSKIPEIIPRSVPGEAQATVRQEWFGAYVQGNMLWPQVFTPGIRILLAAQLIEDPPADLAEFTHSIFAVGQLDQLGMMMNRAHGQQGVPRQYPEQLGSSRGIGAGRLQELWRSSKGVVTSLFLGDQPADASEELNRLFHDQSSRAEYERKADIILTAKKTLLSSDGKMIARLYRERLVAEYHLNDRALQESALRLEEQCRQAQPEWLQQRENIFSKVGKLFGWWLAEDRYLKTEQIIDLMGKVISKQISKKYPDEDADWVTKVPIKVGITEVVRVARRNILGIN